MLFCLVCSLVPASSSISSVLPVLFSYCFTVTPSPLYHFLFTHKFLVVSTFNSRIAEIIVEFLFNQATIEQSNNTKPYQTIIDTTICKLTKTWSQANFITTHSVKQCSYVTQLLLRCFTCYNSISLPSIPPSLSSNSFLSHPCLNDLMNGIQHYFSACQPNIRSLGLKVATLMSQLIEPNDSINFEQIQQDEQDEEDETSDIQKNTTRNVGQEQQEYELEDDDQVFSSLQQFSVTREYFSGCHTSPLFSFIYWLYLCIVCFYFRIFVVSHFHVIYVIVVQCY